MRTFFAVNSKAGSAVPDDDDEEEEDEEHINESTAFVSNNYRRFSPAYRQRKNRWSPDLKDVVCDGGGNGGFGRCTSIATGSRVPSLHPTDVSGQQTFAVNEGDGDDLDAIAAAAAELDGNRPRRPNPLTIIQVKNPAKNVDSGGGSAGCHVLGGDGSGGGGGTFWSTRGDHIHFGRWASRPRHLCVTAVTGLALCLCVAGILSWNLGGSSIGGSTVYCSSPGSCADGGSAAYFLLGNNRANNYQKWTKNFDDIILTSGLEIINKRRVPRSFSPLTSSSYSSRHLQNQPANKHHNKEKLEEEEQLSEAIIFSGYQPRQDTTHHRSERRFSGVIGLGLADGNERWRSELVSKPSKHDCQLLDVDQDGIKDCVVVGENGLMTAINPINGLVLWNVEYHIPLVNFSLPRRLPDLDGDGVGELVAAVAVTLPSEVTDGRHHPRTNFVLISGRQGRLIGRPWQVELCSDISALNVTATLALNFDCISSIGPDQFEVSLAELYFKTTNEDLPRALHLRRSTRQNDIEEMTSKEKESFAKLTQMENYRQFDPVGLDLPETVRDSIHLDWITPRQECPECGCVVRLWDTFAHRLLFNKTFHQSVAFQPLSARYETERWDSPIEGFVFRLWTWDSPGDTFVVGRHKPVSQQHSQPPPKSPPSAESMKRNLDDDQDDIYSLSRRWQDDQDSVDRERAEEEERQSHQQQASSALDVLGSMLPFGHPNLGARRLMAIDSSGGHRTSNHGVATSKHGKTAKSRFGDKAMRRSSRGQPATAAATVRYHEVTESVFYATLNHTEPHMVKLFTHKIVQKCSQPSKGQKFQCLPHYDTQLNSMVIVDETTSDESRQLLFATQTLERGPHSHQDSLKTQLHKRTLQKDIKLMISV